MFSSHVPKDSPRIAALLLCGASNCTRGASFLQLLSRKEEIMGDCSQAVCRLFHDFLLLGFLVICHDWELRHWNQD